jgi:hypothetical protein
MNPCGAHDVFFVVLLDSFRNSLLTLRKKPTERQ